MKIEKRSKRSIEASRKAPWERRENSKRLQDELQEAACKYLMSPQVGFELEDVAECLVVEIHEVQDGVRVEVRCELTYDSMRELAAILDKIVQKYDKDSYFDDVDPGIIEAFIRNGSVSASTEVRASTPMPANENAVWLLDGDSGEWKLWGSTWREADDERWDGFVDAVNAQRNTNYVDLKILKNGGSSPDTVVTAANYGGAYDILPDQYFTKDDIMEFAYDLCDKLGAAYGDEFEVYDVDMKTPQDLYIELSAKDGEYQMAQTLHIDMRKIRKPSDLNKYLDQFAAKFAQDIEEIMRDVGVESPQSAKDLANSFVGSADDPEIKDDINDAEDAELEPEVDPEQEEVADAEASATFSVDATVTVDEDGYWVFDDEDEMFKEIETSGLDAGLLYSEGGSEVAATASIYEDLQKILETFVPGDPGTYRITCKATVVYERDGDVWELSTQKSKITGFRFSEA